jgi:hypothetical protein
VPAAHSETVAVPFTGGGENVSRGDCYPKPVEGLSRKFERIEIFFEFDP